MFKTFSGSIEGSVLRELSNNSGDRSHLSKRVAFEGISDKFTQVKSELRLSEVINEIKSLLTTLLLVITNLLVVIINSFGDPIDEIELVVVLFDDEIGGIRLSTAFNCFVLFLILQVSDN